MQLSLLPISTGRSVSQSTGVFALGAIQFRRAFTMIELLAVMGVMTLMMVMLVPVMGGIKGAGDVTKTAYDVSGALEMARTYAMAHNTYVWVGLFEEDPSQAPGTIGTGRVVVSVVASRDGTKIYSDTNNNPPALDSANLIQISRLLKFENAHLDTLSSADMSRPEITAPNPNDYQVGNPSFSRRNGAANSTTFAHPLSGAAKYTFSKIIQFNPQGDASKIVDTPTRFMEIGLRPTRGNMVDSNSKNLVAIQVAGIGGQVKIYRP